MKELLKALSKAKQEIKPILKEDTNPFFKSKYFDINSLLAQVEPILNSHGLMLLQPLTNIVGDGRGEVVSTIYYVETGDKLESSMTLPDLNDPQKMGSAVTYYRRYTLQSLLALQADDDDGNAASQNNKPVLKRGSTEWKKAVEYMVNNGDINAIKKKYVLSPSDEASLKNG